MGRSCRDESCWILAFFPTLILYSVLVLREPVLFFADCFAWCCKLDAVKWYKAYHIGDDGVHGGHIFSWRHGSRSICVPVFPRVFCIEEIVFGNGQRTPNPTVKYFAGNLYCSIVAVFFWESRYSKNWLL